MMMLMKRKIGMLEQNDDGVVWFGIMMMAHLMMAEKQGQDVVKKM